MFLHDTCETWPIQVNFLLYAHTSQPLSHSHVSPHEVFLNTTAYTSEFSNKPFRNVFCECTAQYCSDLPRHSLYQTIDSNPFFPSMVLEPMPTWFIASEKAMLQVYSKVTRYALKIFFAYKMQDTPNLDIALPFNSSVRHRNLRAVRLSEKLKPHRNCPIKFNNKPTDVTYELSKQNEETFHTHRNHLIPCLLKKLACPDVQPYNE